MEQEERIISIRPADPEILVEIKTLPLMGLVFLKALLISPFRANTLSDHAMVRKARMVLRQFQPDKALIKKYKTVCGFSEDNPDLIPITYLQTLFIGLLGKFITSSFFPVNPLGLIQIFQSFEQKRPVTTGEILDLACILSGFTKKEKGIETTFILEILSDNDVLWQGTAIFFTRTRKKPKRISDKKEDILLKKRETIPVPSSTGRQYAAVSGDYNPHHLYTVLAKPFGFKKAIAHGMWSLARVVASLDREFNLQGPVRIEASFKLPVFMPATTTLGWEQDEESRQTLVNFELRDQEKGLPHLKGKLHLL